MIVRHGAALIGAQHRRAARVPQPRPRRPTAQCDPRGLDQPPALEAAQGGAIGARGGAQLGAAALPLQQRAEHRRLERAEPLLTGQRQAPRIGDPGTQLGSSLHRPAPGPGSGWEHQPETASGGRAVLLGDPEAEPDQLCGGARLQRLQRLGEPAGLDLGVLGDLDHDPEDAARPERNPQHAADTDPRHRRRQAIVEGAAQSPRGGQWLDPGDRHAPNLGSSEDICCPRCRSPFIRARR